MDRQKLVDFLITEKGFAEQNNGPAFSCDNIILDNTNSVGNSVLTFITKNYGRTKRCKIYDKIVCNLEAGEVRCRLGGHLADFANSSNKRLNNLFSNPDVKRRGCVRLEVTDYGATNFSFNFGKKTINEIVSLFRGEKLFYIQPAVNRWKNIMEVVDRSFVIGDMEEKRIYVGHYANTKTRRIVGYNIDCKNANLEKWDSVVNWAIGDFCFKNSPIFVTNVISSDKNTIQLSQLRCFYKEEDSKTILSPSKQPVKIYYNKTNIEEYLPSTSICSFTWRENKCKQINLRKSKYRVIEDFSILKDKEISTLSTKNREKRMEELLYSKNILLWEERIKDYLNSIERLQEKRKQEVITLRQSIINRKNFFKNSYLRHEEVCNCLSSNKTFKTIDLEITQWFLIGFREIGDTTIIALVNNNEKCKVFASPAIKKKLKEIVTTFEYKEDCFKRTTYWFTPNFYLDGKDGEIIIKFLGKKDFVNSQNKNITWVPTYIHHPDKSFNALELINSNEIELEEECNKKELDCFIQKTNPPIPKDSLSSKDIDEGTYLIIRIAEGVFAKQKRTYLFVLKANEEGVPINTEEKIVYGYFIEKEVEKLGGVAKILNAPSPIFCNFGILCTTPSKKKHRKVNIVFNNL